MSDSSLGTITTRVGTLEYLPGPEPVAIPGPDTLTLGQPSAPDAVGPGYHGLKEPGTTPPVPDAKVVDVSTREWDGTEIAAKEWGRETQWVPPSLASYVVQQKKIAEAQAADGLDFSDFLPKLREATLPGRAALEKGRHERAEAVRVGATERQLEALDTVQMAPILRTQDAIRAAVRAVATGALTKLADAEREALTALAAPSVQPDEADYKAAMDLSATLDLMPPAIAVPLVRAMLIEQPVKTGKGLGKVAAMIPLLAARIEKDPQWNASDEARDLVTHLEIVTRNAKWYAAHMRVSKIHELRYKVELLAEDYAAHYGNELAEGYLARNDFYAALGLTDRDKTAYATEAKRLRDERRARMAR